MQPEDLLELRDDLRREGQRLEALARSLTTLLPRVGAELEIVEVAALRLHSFYTGVERCLLLVSRVLNGGTPQQGPGWHRRLLERMAMPSEHRPAVLRELTQRRLQEYLRFRHLVRNLYADELRAEPIALLLRQLPDLWPELEADLSGFCGWLEGLAREAPHSTPSEGG